MPQVVVFCFVYSKKVILSNRQTLLIGHWYPFVIEGCEMEDGIYWPTAAENVLYVSVTLFFLDFSPLLISVVTKDSIGLFCSVFLPLFSHSLTFKIRN